MSGVSPLDRTFRQIARDHRKFRRRLDRLERWDIDDYIVGVNAGTVDDFDNTGATDVTAAFDEAIGNLDDEGGKLEIPAGTYRMDSGLATTKRVKLIGEGRGRTIINCNFAAGDLFTLSGDGSSIEGITIQSTVARTSGSYLVLAANRIAVERCTFVDFYGGIWFHTSGSANDCIIAHCRFETNVVLDGGVAIYERGTKNRVRDCSFAGVLSGSATLPASYPHDAIKIGGGGAASYGATVKDCLIEQFRHGIRPVVTNEDACTIEDIRLVNMGHWAVLVDPETAQAVDYLKLVRVFVKNSVGVVAGGTHGMYFRGSNAGAVGIRDAAVVDCEVTTTVAGSHGLYVDGTATNDLAIRGGRYIGNAVDGIYIYQHDSTQVKVHHVRAKNNGRYGLHFGPGVLYDLKNNELPGNAVRGAWDDDTGAIGGRGKKRKKQSAGNYPDRNNDEFDGLELMDDGTDQTATLQAIIDALPSNGGTIRLPEGTFSYATDINVNKPVVFEGKGREVSILRSTTATAHFNVTVSRVHFRNLSFTTSATRTDKTLYFSTAAHHWRIKDCRFVNDYRSVLNYGNYGVASDSEFETNINSEIAYLNGYHNTIRKCRVVQNNASRVGAGVLLGVDQAAGGTGGNRVLDCEISHFSYGVWLKRSSDGAVVEGNTIYDCDQSWRIAPDTGYTNEGTKIVNNNLRTPLNYGGVIERGGGGSILNLVVSNDSVTGGGCADSQRHPAGLQGRVDHRRRLPG
jgi:hypothetical protein